jgi:ribosomal protein S18 acetylase RimI-like enzyme
MSITYADMQDIPRLNILINSAYRGEVSRQGWTTEADLLDGIRTDEQALTDIIKKRGSWLLKYTDADGNIIGTVHLEHQKEKLYLGMLTVAPPLQGRGIGKELLAAAEQKARQLECKSVYMTVITDRTELIAWYERHGYLKTGQTRPFPMNNPRYGIPKKYLEFTLLEKKNYLIIPESAKLK